MQLVALPVAYQEALFAENALEPLLKKSTREAGRAKLDDPIVETCLETFGKLVTASAPTCAALIKTIERDAAHARRNNAPAFEQSTVCAVLSVSPMALSRAQENSPSFAAIGQFSPNPGANPASVACQQAMSGVWAKQQAALTKLIKSKAAGAGVGREAMLCWFSALFDLQTNSRGAPGQRLKKNQRQPRDIASHGMMLNSTVVLLDWCEPFCNDDPKSAKATKDFARLSPGWTGLGGPQRVHYEVEATLDKPEQGKALRSGSAAQADASLNASGFSHDAEDDEAELAAAIEDSLRSAAIEAETPGEEGEAAAAASPRVEKFENHFVSDAFWLTVRAIGVGVVPALQEAEQLFRQIQDWTRQPDPRYARHLDSYTRQYNALCGQVYAPELITSLVSFYGLVGRWLSQLSSAELATVPEHVVSDMAIVIEHLSTFLPTQLVSNSGAGLGYALGAMVELLRRGKVCKNQLVRESMAKVLERMLDCDRHPSTADLAIAAKDALLSGDQPETVKGLMLTYVDLSKVLDTDGEVFDKNAARAGLARLIELVLGRGPNDELGMPAGLVVKSGPGWYAFCDTLISECIFLFQDATGRLGDLRGMQ